MSRIWRAFGLQSHRRAGTSSLYAALDLTTGKVIGALHSRHRAIEFKQFLQTIEREVPADLDVHLVLDNSSTTRRPRSRSGCSHTPGLQPALHPAWITTWNANLRPFVWTKSAEQILDSIARYCDRINDSRH